jgi:hypothetical protein
LLKGHGYMRSIQKTPPTRTQARMRRVSPHKATGISPIAKNQSVLILFLRCP